MPRFAVLLHQVPADAVRGTHWDLMIEHDGALLTWALEREPRADKTIEATRLPDHRLFYLDYEGEISGGRGDVTRHDQGQCHVVQNDADRVQVNLYGDRLVGKATLDRMADSQRWRFSLVAAADVAVGSS